MTIRITNLTTGEVCEIRRDVCTKHPAWVHEQCGTAGEVELQQCLDGQHVANWYDADGNHLGPDICGIEIFRDSAIVV